MPFAALQQILATRFPTAVPAPSLEPCETVSTGIAEVDALTGGLARSSLVEICGARCSGRTSLLLATLAAATGRGEACALVDARDSFDPHSAHEAGVALDRLLWVRCANIEQSFRAAEWLLLGGGFGLVALDLCELAPQTVRRVPLNVWFRFRRAVEHTPTVLLVLEQQPHASTCASLVLELRHKNSHWSAAVAEEESPSHAKLFSEKQIATQVVRSRFGNFRKEPFLAAQSGEERTAHRCSVTFTASPDFAAEPLPTTNRQ
jgi:hypothetical protein